MPSPRTISAEELRSLSKEIEDGDCVLLDVRERHEFESSHIPLAVLVPLSQIGEAAGGLDPRTKVVVYCRSGSRSRKAAELLVSKGFQDVNVLEGGLKGWSAAGQPLGRE